MKFPRFNRATLSLAGAAVVLATLTGCERDEVRAYRAPKAVAPNAAPTASRPMAAPTAPNASPHGESKVTWTLPATWKEVPTTQQMRLATFDAGGVEVAVSAFPGDVGGPLANVNRWRGQIGLPPATEADLATLLTTTIEGSTQVSILSMTGANGQVLLAASIVPGDGQTWFAKATSDPAKIESIRASFVEFSKSFRMAAAATTPATPPAANPVPAVPAVPPAPAAIGNAIAQRLATTPPPSNWTPDANASSFLAASLTAKNDKGTARATASSLLNDGGGLLANINRWRDQLGLGALADVAEQPIKKLSENAILVDLVNATGTDRQVIIVLTDKANAAAQTTTWFFKLRGTPDAVGAELATFEAWSRAIGGIQ